MFVHLSPGHSSLISVTSKSFVRPLHNGGGVRKARIYNPLLGCKQAARLASSLNFIRKLHASCSGVLTSGFSGEIGALAVHPIGAIKAVPPEKLVKPKSIMLPLITHHSEKNEDLFTHIRL